MEIELQQRFRNWLSKIVRRREEGEDPVQPASSAQDGGHLSANAPEVIPQESGELPALYEVNVFAGQDRYLVLRGEFKRCLREGVSCARALDGYTAKTLFRVTYDEDGEVDMAMYRGQSQHLAEPLMITVERVDANIESYAVPPSLKQGNGAVWCVVSHGMITAIRYRPREFMGSEEFARYASRVKHELRTTYVGEVLRGIVRRGRFYRQDRHAKNDAVPEYAHDFEQAMC